MAIEARGITVEAGGRTILRDVDVTVRPGELLGLVGPNGAGKTTLLRALAGVLAPARGAIRYDGGSAADVGRRALARRVAFLAQGEDISWSLSVEAVVGLGRLPHRRAFGGPTPADRAAIAAALGHCDMAGFAARAMGTLSGGERRRALLARALAVEAPYLLADEPLAGLDPLHQLDVMTLLAQSARRGIGIVVVLHDLTLATRFCGQVVLLDQGRLIAKGPPATVLDEQRLDTVFQIEALRGDHEGEPFLLPWRARSRWRTEDER